MKMPAVRDFATSVILIHRLWTAQMEKTIDKKNENTDPGTQTTDLSSPSLVCQNLLFPNQQALGQDNDQIKTSVF